MEDLRIQKPIDNVTVELLSVSLRLIGIDIPKPVLDKMIDIVELIEDKGETVSLKDICELETSWKESNL